LVHRRQRLGVIFPDDTNRHAIVGMTGTGKTVFGLWCLSQRSYDRIPWIIFDTKLDPIIRELPQLTEVDIRHEPPASRGLYVVRPSPADFDEGLPTQYLYKIWAREGLAHSRRRGTGIFIDEGYSFRALDPALRAVLTQGRSKRIPMICLSQRPAWISPFILSESEFKTVFFLQHQSDIKRVSEWLPARDEHGAAIDPYTLPDHHSYWYGIKGREFRTLGPCPPEQEILDAFDRRRVRRFIF
jgi:DNA helicase HerA-like ATPase